MGQHKLLLPLTGQPLILHTITAWQRSNVDRIVIVVRHDDDSLIEALRESGVEVEIVRAAPPDMKSSIQAGLRHIESQYHPNINDAFLVAPADMPNLSSRMINRLIEQHRSSPSEQILTPTLNGKRGHPVLFRWPLATSVHELGPNEGLDAVVRHHASRPVPCDDLVTEENFPFADIDTPDEYKAIQRERS